MIASLKSNKVIMTFNAVLIFGWLLFDLTIATEAAYQCHSKIDMVILLDSSGSVTEEQFAATKKFAADLVRHFEISKDRTNVATLSFSQYVHTGRKFSDDVSDESVLKAIDALPYEGSFTRLDFALEKLQGVTFSKAQGARPYDKDVKKVVVVVTDGFSSRGVEITKELAGRLKRQGVKFFAVGTSRRVYKDELDELSSKPSESHQLMVDIKKNPFTKDQVEQFTKKICKTE